MSIELIIHNCYVLGKSKGHDFCKQLLNFLWNVFYIPEQEQPDFGDRAIFSNSSASFVQKITGPNSSLFLWTSILKRTKVILFTKYFFQIFRRPEKSSWFGNCTAARIAGIWQLTLAQIFCFFFTGSRSLALKSSSKSHQMTTFCSNLISYQ